MRLLLDECLPKRLGQHLTGHSVNTVPEMKWASIKNGRLLFLAEKQFDVFLTIDQNLPSQQHIAQYRIAVVILRSRSNRLKDLLPLVQEILRVLPRAVKGKVVLVPG